MNLTKTNKKRRRQLFRKAFVDNKLGTYGFYSISSCLVAQMFKFIGSDLTDFHKDLDNASKFFGFPRQRLLEVYGGNGWKLMRPLDKQNALATFDDLCDKAEQPSRKKAFRKSFVEKESEFRFNDPDNCLIGQLVESVGGNTGRDYLTSLEKVIDYYGLKVDVARLRRINGGGCWALGDDADLNYENALATLDKLFEQV